MSTSRATMRVETARSVPFEEDDDDNVAGFGSKEAIPEEDTWGTRNLEELPAKDDRPSHHCRYCYQDDPTAVVQCTKCDKWFCNSGMGMNTAHILNHLRTGHRGECSIQLHESSPLGDAKVECYLCGSTNVFGLGFVQVGEGDEREAVLLCREPCMQRQHIKDSSGEKKWKSDDWQSLIEPGRLRSWLVHVPSKESVTKCYRIRRQEMRHLEAAWKKNPDADLTSKEVKAERTIPVLPPLPLKFHDGPEYQDAFLALLREEASNSRRNAEATKFNNLAGIQYRRGVNGVVATMDIPRGVGKTPQGQSVRLQVGANVLSGTVLKVAAGDGRQQVDVQLSTKKMPDGAAAAQLELSFNATPFQRMSRAIKTMIDDETSISSDLFDCILGHKAPDQLRNLKVSQKLPKDLQTHKAGGLPRLNAVQADAVGKILPKPIGLIQGPPGTGKTVTAAHLVHHMVNCYDSQVLVCSPSNVACDQMCEKLIQANLKVVRVLAVSRETLGTCAVESLSLHHLVAAKVKEDEGKHQELVNLMELRTEMGELELRDYKRYRSLAGVVETEILQNADVVCCTCVAAGDRRLERFRFKHVVIDEATQGVEPETLIPLTTGAKQVILVGDHCQMGPVVQHRPVEVAGLGRSLFERLRLLNFEPALLTVQYRMHPFLPRFSSTHFYNGALIDGVTASDRDSASAFSWVDPTKPSVFVNVVGKDDREEVGDGGKSFLNRSEGKAVLTVLKDLLKRKQVRPDQIGVITPYEAQRCHILNEFDRSPELATHASTIEVASLDSFQGREKEFIVMSCVRSSEDQGIGFINSWQRLNVALTRARRGCILVGDAASLSKGASVWHALLKHYDEEGVIVTPTLTRDTAVHIPVPTTTQGFGPEHLKAQQARRRAKK